MISSFRSARRRAFLPFLAAGLTLLFLVVAQALGKKKKPVEAAPQGLPDQILALGQKLLGTPLDESDELTGQVQKLVLDDLQKWFARNPPGPSPDGAPYEVRVRRVMDSAFSKLHYPVFAQPKTFSGAWNGGVLTGCGYTLGWSDYDRVNVIALFETHDGATRLAGVDHFVQRTDLEFEDMPSPDSKTFRFLAYGIRLGKSQPRLSAELYAYDGQSMKSLWQTHDVYDGKIDVDKGTVTIRYLREDEYIREQANRRKPPRHLAIYKSSPQGLTLQSDTNIPF